MAVNTLIVEDDPNFEKLVQLRLKASIPEIAMRTATTLKRAREILDEPGTSFQLVILDQHLPDGYGSTLFDHPKLKEAAVLAVSSDDSPEVPSRALIAGAQHFLGKRQVSEPLFIPLVLALIERKKLEQEVFQARLRQSRMETIKVLLGTLRHEINNPLGAVLGGAYIMRLSGELGTDQVEALKLIEASGQRIKHVIQQLCETAELEEVTKGSEQVFHVPGDPRWDAEKKKS